MTKKTNSRTIILLAIFMVGCGLLAIAWAAISLLDYPPKIYHSAAILRPPSESPEKLQPRPNEWPLVVAKEFHTPRPPEHYNIEVRSVRGSDLMMIKASSSSRERANALASWLGNTYVTSLNESYSSRDLTPERKAAMWSLPEDESLSYSNSKPLSLVSHFFLPTLVLISGIALFLARR